MPAPSFDTWTIVFLIAAVQGFFVAGVLLRWQRGHRQANLLMAILLLLFSFTLVEYVMYWTGYMYRFIHIANLSAQFPFLFGPLVLGYLRTIYTGRSLSWTDLWHLLPFFIAIALFWPWLSMSAEAKLQVTQQQAHSPLSREVQVLLTWSRIAHMVVYTALNARFIWQQPRVGATARWATLLNICYTGFALAYASYFILIRFPFFNLAWDYHISAAMTVFIYLIAYAGYVQPAVFEGFAWSEPAAPVKYKNSGLTPDASRSMLVKMNELMGKEQLYRDPELSLETLANRMNASKHHVSQVINEHIGASFFEYINQLRIEEAKQLLAENSRSDLHVIEAAYAVGFNNKVSFNAAFKKSTGMTPTEYRRHHSKTDSTQGQPGAVGER